MATEVDSPTRRTQSEPLGDAELISAARSGDSGAYATLRARHSHAALRLACTLTDDPREAGDLVDETFAGILAALRDGHGPDLAFRTYLHTSLRDTFHGRAITRDASGEIPPDTPAEVTVGATDTGTAGLSESDAAEDATEVISDHPAATDAPSDEPGAAGEPDAAGAPDVPAAVRPEPPPAAHGRPVPDDTAKDDTAKDDTVLHHTLTDDTLLHHTLTDDVLHDAVESDTAEAGTVTDEPVEDPAARARRAFRGLPERSQLVLWHTEVEGESPAAIAPLLGMTPSGVGALAHRTRERFHSAVYGEDAPYGPHRVAGFARLLAPPVLGSTWMAYLAEADAAASTGVLAVLANAVVRRVREVNEWVSARTGAVAAGMLTAVVIAVVATLALLLSNGPPPAPSRPEPPAAGPGGESTAPPTSTSPSPSLSASPSSASPGPSAERPRDQPGAPTRRPRPDQPSQTTDDGHLPLPPILSPNPRGSMFTGGLGFR